MKNNRKGVELSGGVRGRIWLKSVTFALPETVDDPRFKIKSKPS
jgi:hypothetical protein